ncbi:hypothetical protein ACLOJK_018900 [Asimina triloba]
MIKKIMIQQMRELSFPRHQEDKIPPEDKDIQEIPQPITRQNPDNEDNGDNALSEKSSFGENTTGNFSGDGDSGASFDSIALHNLDT